MFPITSETALNPDDSRASGPVEVTRNVFGGIQLWTALDAALTPRGHHHRPGRRRLVPHRCPLASASPSRGT